MKHLCRTCAYRSDGINIRSLDYCYCLDKDIKRNDPGCDEWRSSLRDEPLNDPPEAKLIARVAELDNEEEN